MNTSRQNNPANPDIRSPDDAALTALCDRLATRASTLDGPNTWPGESLADCGRSGVFRWFVPESLGGFGWSASDIVRGYIRLSAACLTTTFVITQLTGAVRRIVGSGKIELQSRLLPDLLTGDVLATLGISHLTTSGQHKKQPALIAHETDKGFVLNGFSPWVTGANRAQYLVIGAAMEDSRQLMTVVPTSLAGVECVTPAELVALSSSQTGAVRFENTLVSHDWLLAGPVDNVIQLGTGGSTGGLQTSTLALGLATAALEFIRRESGQRSDLLAPLDQLQAEVDAAIGQLITLAERGTVGSDEASRGEEEGLTLFSMRAKANSVVLRATQAALVAAKGAGYVAGHPAGRWCQQALFFLVWSCPQPVLTANLCELAGLE